MGGTVWKPDGGWGDEGRGGGGVAGWGAGLFSSSSSNIQDQCLIITDIIKCGFSIADNISEQNGEYIAD